MEALIVEGTKCTPKVNFSLDGILTIEGRSLPEDPFTFYNPLLAWIRSFQGEKLTLDIRLEYMNTASSKQIFTLLSDISDNSAIKDVIINWHYEQDDDDALDTGKEFESMVKLKFNFLEYAEA